MTARATAIVAAISAVAAIAPASALAATADLAIDKTDSVDPATVGTEFAYELALTNKGPEDANGVQVVDTLPNQLDFVAANPSQGACKQAGKKVTCDLGTLANGAGATVTIRVNPRKAGQIVNSATVTTTDTDPVGANDTDAETTNVIEPPAAPQCAGQEATIIGTTGDDQLTGTAKKDVFVALGGNDTILGLGGDDLVSPRPAMTPSRARPATTSCAPAAATTPSRAATETTCCGAAAERPAGWRPGSDALRGGGGPDRCNGGPANDTERGCWAPPAPAERRERRQAASADSISAPSSASRWRSEPSFDQRKKLRAPRVGRGVRAARRPGGDPTRVEVALAASACGRAKREMLGGEPLCASAVGSRVGGDPGGEEDLLLDPEAVAPGERR